MSDEAVEKVLDAAATYARTPVEQRSTTQLDDIDAVSGNDPAVLNQALQRLRREQEPEEWKDIADALVDAATNAGYEVTAVPGFYIGPRRT